MTRRALVTCLVVAGCTVVGLLVAERGRGPLAPQEPIADVAHDDELAAPDTGALTVPHESEALPPGSVADPRETDRVDVQSAHPARFDAKNSLEADAVIEVTVVAAESGATLDVSVTCGDRDASRYRGASTGWSGRCDWTVSPGDYDLRVGGDGRYWRKAGTHWFAERVETEVKLVPVDGLRLGEHRGVTVALRTVPDRFHHVQVVDSVTKQPIPGAWVDLFDPQLSRIEDVDEICTRLLADSEGRLACCIPSWRVVPVRAGSPDHVQRFTFLSPSPTSSDSPEILALDSWATLEVVLLDERAHPTTHVRVKAIQEETSFDADDDGYFDLRLPGITLVAETDRDGVARFERLVPEMSAHLSICRDVAFDRIIATPVTLAPGETRRVSYGLFGTSLRGVLQDTRNRPIAELPVWLLPCAVTPAPSATLVLVDDEHDAARRTTTDRNGTFAFADVTPGWWWVGPAPTGDPPQHGYATLATAVEVRADVATTEVLLTAAGER